MSKKGKKTKIRIYNLFFSFLKNHHFRPSWTHYFQNGPKRSGKDRSREHLFSNKNSEKNGLTGPKNPKITGNFDLVSALPPTFFSIFFWNKVYIRPIFWHGLLDKTSQGGPRRPKTLKFYKGKIFQILKVQKYNLFFWHFFGIFYQYL